MASPKTQTTNAIREARLAGSVGSVREAASRATLSIVSEIADLHTALPSSRTREILRLAPSAPNEIGMTVRLAEAIAHEIAELAADPPWMMSTGSYLDLSDTSDISYAGKAHWFPKVNDAETAVDLFNLFGTANYWTQINTFHDAIDFRNPSTSIQRSGEGVLLLVGQQHIGFESQGSARLEMYPGGANGGYLEMLAGGSNPRIDWQTSDTIKLQDGTGSHVTQLSVNSSGVTIGTLNGFIKGTSGLLSAVAAINVTTDITGVVPVANGGTGLSSCVRGDLFVGSGSNTIATLSLGSSGLPLIADSATGDGVKWAQVGTAGIADNAVTVAKLQDIGGFTVIGRAVGGTGDPSTVSFTATGGIANVLIYSDGTGRVAAAFMGSGSPSSSNFLRGDRSWSAVTLTADVTGTLPIANGGTGQTTQTAAFDALSPLTTKGDIIVFNGTDAIRLAVGADTEVLTADSTTASGVKWAGVPGGVSTYLALTDTTDASYAGTAGFFPQVNGGATALTLFNLFGTANTWTADQTLATTSALFFRNANTWILSPSSGVMQISSTTRTEILDGVTQIAEFQSPSGGEARLTLFGTKDWWFHIDGITGDMAINRQDSGGINTDIMIWGFRTIAFQNPTTPVTLSYASAGLLDVTGSFTLSGTLTVASLTGLLKSASGVVSALAHGTDGHVLTMVSGAPAWIAPGVGGIANAYAVITDGSTTASASGADTFKLRTANSILTIAVANNDATHGDNALFTIAQANIDHGSIGGLSDDDHSQYVLLAGRSGGQNLRGGTGAAEALTLRATAHATKGIIYFGVSGPSTAQVDETTETLSARQYVSHVATGTAPLVVTSTTKVTNLNADLLDGLDSAAFALAVHAHSAADITSGTLAVARGGTNIASYTAGDLLHATGSTTLSKLGVGTNGQVLTVVAGAPAWASPSAAFNLNDLGDVTITAVANNHFLKYDSGSSMWANYDLFGTSNTWTATQTFNDELNITNANTQVFRNGEGVLALKGTSRVDILRGSVTIASFGNRTITLDDPADSSDHIIDFATTNQILLRPRGTTTMTFTNASTLMASSIPLRFATSNQRIVGTAGSLEITSDALLSDLALKSTGGGGTCHVDANSNFYVRIGGGLTTMLSTTSGGTTLSGTTTLGTLSGVLLGSSGVVSAITTGTNGQVLTVVGGVPAFASPGTAFALDDLTDVTITSPVTGSFLQWSGLAWIDFNLFAASNTWTGANTFSNTINIDANSLVATTVALRFGDSSQSIVGTAATKTLDITASGASSVINLFSSGISGVLNLRATATTNINTNAASAVNIGHASGTLGFLGATAIDQQSTTADLKDTICGFGFQANGGASPLNLDGGQLSCGAARIGGAILDNSGNTILDLIETGSANYITVHNANAASGVALRSAGSDVGIDFIIDAKNASSVGSVKLRVDGNEMFASERVGGILANRMGGACTRLYFANTFDVMNDTDDSAFLRMVSRLNTGARLNTLLSAGNYNGSAHRYAQLGGVVNTEDTVRDLPDLDGTLTAISTYTTVARELGDNGDSLELRFEVAVSGSGTPMKEIGVSVGGTTVYSSGMSAFATGSAIVICRTTRISSTAIRASVSVNSTVAAWSNAAIPADVTVSDLDTNTLAVSLLGASNGVGEALTDVQVKGRIVWWWPNKS